MLYETVSLPRGLCSVDRDTTLRLVAEIQEEMAVLVATGERAARAAARFGANEPDEFEIGGVAATLHEFYSVAENLFKRIALELNGGLPAGGDWHVQLLRDMALEIPGVRPAVVRRSTANQLKEFLDFRHRFRHTYGFELRWPPMRELVGRVPAAQEALQDDVERFVSFLRELAAGA